MFANDVPLQDWCRLFNVKVSHNLKEFVVRHETDLSTGIFTYIINLMENTGELQFMTHQELIELTDEHECSYLLDDDIEAILTNHSPDHVKVVMLIFDPRGTPCCSAYGFEKPDIIDNSPILLGRCPAIHVENPWFSHQILISSFTKMIQAVMIERIPVGHLCILIAGSDTIEKWCLPF